MIGDSGGKVCVGPIHFESAMNQRGNPNTHVTTLTPTIAGTSSLSDRATEVTIHNAGSRPAKNNPHSAWFLPESGGEKRPIKPSQADWGSRGRHNCHFFLGAQFDILGSNKTKMEFAVK